MNSKRNSTGKPARQPVSRRSRSVPQGNTESAARQSGRKTEGAQTERSKTTAPQTPVTKAKKMLVRQPNQEQQNRAYRLRERRTGLDDIEPVRLQKALAASGVGSRREMEDWIAQGLVTVNGKTAVVGDKVGPRDRVLVKGSVIKLKWADRLPRIILYNKQEGEIVSRDDPKGRVSVFSRVTAAKSSRWLSIGRLDINTSGLLILTTNGELVNRFAHPSFEVEREYSVRLLGTLTPEQLKQLTVDGVQLEDGLARVQMIVSEGGEGVNQWYRVVIKEGRNREVRRIFEALGLGVSRLIRIRFGPVTLPSRLKRGQYYELNEIEVADIVKWAEMLLPGERKRPSKK